MKKTGKSYKGAVHAGMKRSRESLIKVYTEGRYQNAKDLASAFVRAHPKDTMGWKVMGVSLARLEMLPEAVEPFRKVIELAPLEAEAHFNLGAVLHELGQFQEAEALYRKSIALQQENHQALNNLANLLCDLHRPDEAEVFFRKALAIKSNDAQCMSNYAGALMMLERPDEAEKSARQAASLQPGYAKAWVNLGGALRMQGKYDEAVHALQQAISLTPGEAMAFNNMGSVFVDMGRIEEAKVIFGRALELNPLYAECHNNLSQLKTYSSGDPHIPLLRKLYQTLQNPVARMHICFALGKACADLGQHGEAFDMLSEGNRLARQALGYDFEQDRELFARIRSAFEKLHGQSKIGIFSCHGILIVGMPRSGTTLVEQILASHPDVTGGGELGYLSQLALESLDQMPAGWEGVAEAYDRKLADLCAGRSWITDKMPLNFRWLGFVLWANPSLKVLHVMRDPMATCWSIFKQYFPSKGLGFAHDLKDLGNYYCLYRDIMNYWHEKFPERIYDLDYERLTENQETETKRLLEYCGLPWDERCLEFEKSERPVRTASAVQVRQKMYRGSSQAWRSYDAYLGPLKEALRKCE